MDIPDPHDLPCGIVLVGTTDGMPDIRGEFTIVLLDLAENPIAGADIGIDFDACASDIRISDVQPWAGSSVECSGPIGIVHGTTDAAGSVVFRIVGAARNTAAESPGAGFKCATVYADGMLLGTMNVAAYDQNGEGGVNPADLSVWLPDSFSGVYRGRSDFNCSNTINPADLAMLLGASFGAGSLQSAADYCH